MNPLVRLFSLTAAVVSPALFSNLAFSQVLTPSKEETEESDKSPSEIPGAFMDSLVLIESSESQGSGFLMKDSGKLYVVSNAHVIQHAKGARIRTLRGTEINPGSWQVCDLDLVRAEVSDVHPALEMYQESDGALQLEDSVVVLGNSGGAGAVRSFAGKIVGLGFDRIETDAAFVAGNSGSPVIHLGTGKVVGVATYLTAPMKAATQIQQAAQLNDVRRFALRLDSVRNWQDPGAKRLNSEWKKLSEAKELTEALTFVAIQKGIGAVQHFDSDLVVAWGLTPDGEVAKDVRHQIKSFQKRINAVNLSLTDRKKEIASFYSSLVPLCKNDLRGFEKKHFTGINSQQFEEISEVRKSLIDYFSEVSNNLRNQGHSTVSIEPYNGPFLKNSQVGGNTPQAPSTYTGGGIMDMLRDTVWSWCPPQGRQLDDRNTTVTFHSDGTATGSWIGRKSKVDVLEDNKILWGGHTLTFNREVDEFTGHWTSQTDRRWGKRIQ